MVLLRVCPLVRVAGPTKVSVEVVLPRVAVKMLSFTALHGWLGLLHQAAKLSLPVLLIDTHVNPPFWLMFSQVVCCPDWFSVSYMAPLVLLHAGRLAHSVVVVQITMHRSKTGHIGFIVFPI